MTAYDVGIVGLGAMGSMTALELAREMRHEEVILVQDAAAGALVVSLARARSIGEDISLR